MKPSLRRQRQTLAPGLAAGLLLCAALGLPAAPAQASEVVKLARLVITGQRSPAADPAVQAAAVRPVEKLPRVLVEGRRSEDGVQEDRQYAAQRRSQPRAL